MFPTVSISDPIIRSRSSSSHSVHDHFSLQFEEIVEQCSSTNNNNNNTNNNNNKRLSQQRNIVQTPPIPGPFILPLSLDNESVLSPLSTTLTKSTNSRAILKHIQDIENEIRLMKNIDKPELEQEEESPYSILDLNNNDDRRNTIYEQVDLWVEKCLQTQEIDTNISHNDSTRLSDTIKDFVLFVCSDNEDENKNTKKVSTSQIESNSKLMTAFYLSSTPKETILSVDNEQIENEKEYVLLKKDSGKLPKRTISMIEHDSPLQTRTPKQTIIQQRLRQKPNSSLVTDTRCKSMHECPF
ncbi:unnamed protein product [Didymodactylos carnosus]|nr:unnamed protein product [Didymodactylos carnosus]CAF4399849.1 unnamed protein product [Didymodactylos carnosus]